MISTVQDMARKSPNREICGVIDSTGGIHPITNVASADGDFVFDKREYFSLLNALSKEGKEVKAIYHSHPFTPPLPSPADLACQKNIKKDFLIVSFDTHTWVPYAEI